MLEEVQGLHAKRRFELPLPFAEWLARAADDRVISVLSLSVEVIFGSLLGSGLYVIRPRGELSYKVKA